MLPVKVITGVYFLCDADSIVYIGASTNVIKTAYTPDIARPAWDRMYYIPAPETEMYKLRNALLQKYQPRFNVPTWRKDDPHAA